MKRSSFAKKPYEEVIAKKRKATERAVKRVKAKPKKTIKKKVKRAKKPTPWAKKRKKLPTIKTMRNKADKLLTPIIKKRHPICFLQIADGCSGYTQVAHHHIKKSQSSAVRYDLDNLIPLCHRCHCKLHSQETTWSSLVVEKKGIDWWKQLYFRSVDTVKTDVHFYIEHYNRLKAICDKEECLEK